MDDVVALIVRVSCSRVHRIREDSLHFHMPRPLGTYMIRLTL